MSSIGEIRFVRGDEEDRRSVPSGMPWPPGVGPDTPTIPLFPQQPTTPSGGFPPNMPVPPDVTPDAPTWPGTGPATPPGPRQRR